VHEPEVGLWGREGSRRGDRWGEAGGDGCDDSLSYHTRAEHMGAPEPRRWLRCCAWRRAEPTAGAAARVRRLIIAAGVRHSVEAEAPKGFKVVVGDPGVARHAVQAAVQGVEKVESWR
jgi:hypothetical protein